MAINPTNIMTKEQIIEFGKVIDKYNEEHCPIDVSPYDPSIPAVVLEARNPNSNINYSDIELLQKLQK